MLPVRKKNFVGEIFDFELAAFGIEIDLGPAKFGVLVVGHPEKTGDRSGSKTGHRVIIQHGHRSAGQKEDLRLLRPLA